MVNRNRLPRWVNALIDAIADAPMSPIGRLAARRMGTPAPAGTIPAITFAERPIRVLIAPVNYSGQARAWAQALEASSPEISARNTAMDVPGGFSFDADLIVPVATFHNDADWQRRQFDAAAHATHVLIEAAEPPFGRMLGRSVEAQVEALRARGVDIAYLAHGTEIRVPSRDLRDNPWSHYADPEIYAPRDETLARRNIALLRRSGRPLFVSTPDLLLDLPEAHWCPVVVDLSRWEPAAPRTERPAGAPLRVAHAPSVSTIKGTHLILPTLRALEAEGTIELQLITGVPSAQMPAKFAEADVVIDQMRIGSYGVAAAEAMAAGCVVVGHIAPRVREIVEDATGSPPPIVEATVDTIEQVLRELAAGDLRTLRTRSREFVTQVHDGTRSAATLRTHWIDAGARPDTEGTSDASPR